ncbi:hypothetical protein HPB52_023265 [Rhipicephalus sanguineus]|uniref:Uncharacterized protein n=1 Tax=Rhipicephalus sanguineus TaxID=34632 RepID=A0A9D4QBH5_RHISA|nr:hypothetical protein HPB52_023265 [Rhipicephalus sanguineus]
MAAAHILYGLPLASLTRNNWEQLDTVHQAAIRQYHGLLRISPIGLTLAEVREMPLSLCTEL